MPFRGCCGPKEGESPPRAPAAVRHSPPAAPARPIFAWKRSQGCFVCSTLLSIKERDGSSFPKFPAAGTQQMSPRRARAGAGCRWNHPHSTEHRDHAGPPGLPAPGRTRRARDRTKLGILRLLSHPRDPHGTRRTGLLHPHLPALTPRCQSPPIPRDAPMGRWKNAQHVLGTAASSRGTSPTSRGVIPASPSTERSRPTPSDQVGRGWGEQSLCPKVRSLQSPQAWLRPLQAPCPSGHPKAVPSSAEHTPGLPHNPEFWAAPEHPRTNLPKAPPARGSGQPPHKDTWAGQRPRSGKSGLSAWKEIFIKN